MANRWTARVAAAALTGSIAHCAIGTACGQSVTQTKTDGERDDDDAGDQPTIVVTGHRIVSTATKTDIPLIETPQSISVVTGESLAVRNTQRIKDALELTAGVQVDKYGGDTRYDQIELRGFSATEFGEYRDGLRQVSAGSIFYKNEPYGLDSIEVLKGPSSVLFGQNAPGGLFNLISKRATRETLLEAQVDLGSFDYHQIKADVGGSLVGSGDLYARLTVLARDAGTYLPQRSRDDRIYVAPTATWEISPAVKLTAYLQYLKNESVGSPFGYTDEGLNYFNIRTYDPNFDRLGQRQLLAGWSFEAKLSDHLTFRQNARYGHVKLIYKLTDALINPVGVTDVEREAYSVDGTLRSYAIDNQLSEKLDLGAAQLSLLLGYDYTLTNSREDDRYGYGAADGIPGFDLANPTYGNVTFPDLPELLNNKRRDTQGGVYAQGQAKLSGWIATAGIRRDATRSKIDDLLGDGDTLQKKDATTWRVGLTKLFSNGLAPYASYSTSFQIVPGTDFFGNAFQPSRGRQVEAGVKYQPKAFRGFVTASVFRLVQDNVLIDDPDHFQEGFSIQSGRIRSQGVELEASLNPTRGLDLSAAFTYQDLSYRDHADPNFGKTPSSTPKVITSASALYTVPSGGLSGFSLGGTLRYTGRTYNDNADTIRNHDEALYADALAAYNWEHWRIGVNADNLFDKRTVTCNLGFCYQVVGRDVLVSLRYRY